MYFYYVLIYKLVLFLKFDFDFDFKGERVFFGNLYVGLVNIELIFEVVNNLEF